MKRLLLGLCLFLVACGSNRATPTPESVTSPASGVALVEQAASLLLDRYVEPLDSAILYTAAYRGAADVAQALGGTPQSLPPDFGNDARADAARFREAYLDLARLPEANGHQTALAYGAIQAMTEAIDECHTSFLTPEQYRAVTAQLAGEAHYAGIGVSIRAGTHPLVIGEVFPDTPAAEAGLRPGDAILAVNGTAVSALSIEQVGQLVRGAAGTTVTLTIRRPEESETRQVTLVRAEVALPVLTSRVIAGIDGGQIGYIKLYSFSTGAETKLQDALEEFDRQGVQGWILDLRDNGGGYIDTLQKIASRFIAGGKPIAYTIGRDSPKEPIGTNPTLTRESQRPLAILINEGSASSSEALAAAAQDYGFARLFGQTTAGCLATASTFPLADVTALQITIQKVVSPEGREINRIGVRPDEVVASAPASPTDPVIEAALRWLAAQIQARNADVPAWVTTSRVPVLAERGLTRGCPAPAVPVSPCSLKTVTKFDHDR